MIILGYGKGINGGDKWMMNDGIKPFICFSSKDRYTIAEPMVYHLKNYGLDIWYDRYSLTMGDNRVAKNIREGAGECDYAIIIISVNTITSKCAMEEIDVIKSRYFLGQVTVFPVLYEISPDNIPVSLKWVKQLIYKEVSRSTGCRQISNHILCKIMKDIIKENNIKDLQTSINSYNSSLPIITSKLLKDYVYIDSHNINSKITMIYAAYVSLLTDVEKFNNEISLASAIFERLFAETRLYLAVDYREIRLLEYAMCVLLHNHNAILIESNI